MSTEIYRKDFDGINFTITRFYGGHRRGTMVQICIDNYFVQINLEEALDIIEALNRVIDDFTKIKGGIN